MTTLLPRSIAQRLFIGLGLALAIMLALAPSPAAADGSQWVVSQPNWSNQSNGWHRQWRNNSQGDNWHHRHHNNDGFRRCFGSCFIVGGAGVIFANPGFIVGQPGFVIAQPSFIVRQPGFVLGRPTFFANQRAFIKRHPSLQLGQPMRHRSFMHQGGMRIVRPGMMN